MATLAMMRAKFPEANAVSDVLITFALAEGAVELDQSVWGCFGQPGGMMTKADLGQMYLAMHKIAISPFAANVKVAINAKKVGYARTTYGEEFLLLQRGVTSGFRVA